MPRPDTMKAMVLPEFGASLRLATVPVPKIGPNAVLLRVRAAGGGLNVVIMTRGPGRVAWFPRLQVAGLRGAAGAPRAPAQRGLGRRLDLDAPSAPRA